MPQPRKFPVYACNDFTLFRIWPERQRTPYVLTVLSSPRTGPQHLDYHNAALYLVRNTKLNVMRICALLSGAEQWAELIQREAPE